MIRIVAKITFAKSSTLLIIIVEDIYFEMAIV